MHMLAVTAEPYQSMIVALLRESSPYVFHIPHTCLQEIFCGCRAADAFITSDHIPLPATTIYDPPVIISVISCVLLPALELLIIV